MSRMISFPANRQPLGQLKFSKTLSAHAPDWVVASFKMHKAGPTSKKWGSTYKYIMNVVLDLVYLGVNT
jgi:hypothetical protein